MANYELLMPYTEDWVSLLAQEGCTAPPPISEGNRWPRREEVIAAVQAEGMIAEPSGPEDIMVLLPADAPEVLQAQLRTLVRVQPGLDGGLQTAGESSYLVWFTCSDWEHVGEDRVGVFIHGQNWPLEVFLTHRLAQACGQLVLYSSGGGIPVVVGPDSDPGRLSTLWLEADPRPDAVQWFYEQLACEPGGG